ncbi:hypothetical protein ACQP2U_23960 [Nocardia sp. CA-084685]|uniref:hypothetical protein n=1 Tax=Nocardia sp. CA-084685 TaxID=3239970 RepID=UPI003D962550
MASGGSSTDGAPPSAPPTPDDTSYIDTSSPPTTSPSNPWTGLTAQGKSQTLTMAHNSAIACAAAADRALSRIRGIESATNLLYLRSSMGEYPTGYLSSGTQMAVAFNDRATKLEDCLKRHEVVLQGMIDTFHAADKLYKATDSANAGLFGNSPSVAATSLALDSASVDLDPSISPSSVLPSGVAYDPDKTAPTDSELYTRKAQLPGVIHDEHGVDHLDNQGVLKSMDGDSQRASAGANPALTEPTRVFDAPLNLENSDSLHRDEFYRLYLSIDYAQVMHAAAQWLYLSQQLSMGMNDLRTALKDIVGGGDSGVGIAPWQGAGAVQANQASNDYVNSAQDLADNMKIMGSKLIFTAEWLNQFRIMLPDNSDYNSDHESDWRHHFDQFYKPGATASMASMPKMPMPVDATTGSTVPNPLTNPAGGSALTGVDPKVLSDAVYNDAAARLDGQLKDPNSGLGHVLADYKKYADAAAAAGGGHYGSSGAANGGSTGGNTAGAAAKSAATDQPTPLEQQILTRLDKLEAQAAKQPNSNYQVPTANPPGPLERIVQPIQGRPTSPLDGQTQTSAGTAAGVAGNAGDPVYPASYSPYSTAGQSQAELSELAAIGQQVAGVFQQFTNLLAQEIQQLTPSIEQALDAAAHHDMMDREAKDPGGHDQAGPGPDEPPRAQPRMFPREELLADMPIAAAGQAVDAVTGGADAAQDDATTQANATAEPSVDA